MGKKDSISVGNAGEYFVAGELERRGLTVAVPMSNVKDFDILAINRTNYKQFAVQVKTTGAKTKRWMMSKKNEELVGENIIYVLVSLNELDMPEYHIVPSKILAPKIKEDYKIWLDTPGHNGQPHNDTSMRVFSDFDDQYLNKWEYFE